MHFNRVLSLLILIAVVVAAALMAVVVISDEAAAIDPYDPNIRVSSGHTADKSGDPGEKVKFYIDLENTGSEDDTYDITNTSVPAGWKVTISPNSVSLDSGDDQQIIISIESPSNAGSDDSVDVTITATSTEDTDTPPAKATILLTYDVDQEFDVTLKPVTGEALTKDVDPGNTVSFSLNVSNAGNGEDTIAMSKELPSGSTGWVVIFSSNQVTLKRDIYTTVTIQVTVPNSADAGQFPIDIRATSEDGIEYDVQTIIPDVNYKPDFVVLPYGSNQKKVEPKESVTYGVSIENKGNDQDNFKISIRSGAWEASGWTATLDYLSITIDQDETINIESLLTVNAPDGLADAEANIVVNVTSGDGALLKTLNTRTKISQTYEPTINIIGGTSKNVDPGEDVTFTVEVLNAGNGEDEITLSIKNNDLEPGSWGSFSDSSVILTAGSKTSITLTVTPPSEAPYLSEGYTLQIFGTSEDGENVSTTKTLKVNVNKEFDLSVTISGSSTKKANPDETIEFTVSVKNKGNVEDTILLTLYGNDATWKPEWGSIVSSVDLLRDASATLTLSVTVPNDAAKADYKIGVRGTSDDDPAVPPKSVNAEVIVSVNQVYAIIITIPASQKTVDVNSQVDYDLEIKNDGTGADTITLEVVDYPDGWQVNFNQSTLVLDAKKSTWVRMMVKTPSSEEHMAFYINFTATSQEAPDTAPVVKTGTTITTVNQTFEFNIDPNPDFLTSLPGKTVSFDVSFENTGTGDDHINIAKGGGYPDTWTVSIASQLAILKDQTVKKTLTVYIDDETLKGEYHIELTGTSIDDPHNPAFTRAVTITINVEQLYNLTVSIGTDTRNIDPFPVGQSHKVTFDFTVNNTGTGIDKFKFEAVFDATPVRKNGWSVAFSPQTIDLGVKKSGQVNAIVAVPDRENIDTYGITLTVTSNGDLTVKRTLHVKVQVNQTYSLDITTDFNTQTIVPAKVTGTLTQVNYTLTITNTGTGDDKFYLSLIGLPAGWFMNLPGNTGTIGMGQKATAMLNVKVPGREAPKTYNLSVQAVSDGASEIKKTIVLQVVVNELHTLELTTTEPTKKGDVNAFTQFIVMVTNKGTGTDTFTFDFRDVPTQLTVSFPDGTGTEQVGQNEQIEKLIRVFVEDKTNKAKFSFNITVTSDEDANIMQAIKLTVDVNQSYKLKASLVGSPPGNKVEPDSTVLYTWEVTNDGTGKDSITIEVPTIFDNKTNIPAGWKVTPIPYSFDLEARVAREIQLEVEVDKNAKPETVLINLYFTFHDGDERITKDMTVIVNQTFDVSTNLDNNLLEIFPGFENNATLTIKNTGTGSDYYKVEISNNDGITAKVNISLTDNIVPGAVLEVRVNFLVGGGEKPRIVKYWINVTSQEADEEGLLVMKTSTIEIKIKETYGAFMGQTEATYPVTPTHDTSGKRVFSITVKNEGSSSDTFNFAPRTDPQTTKYKKFITLPNSIILAPGASTTVDITIEVDPFEIDPEAKADGKLKNITFYVYSKGARDNNVEVQGETTVDFLCHVNIEEYRYASFTVVTPSSVTMDVDDVVIINVTLKNEGNGREPYSFIKDGKNGGGQFIIWYEFLTASVELDPFESQQVSIRVSPSSDAPVGIHDLEFHAKSETLYVSDSESFRIDIEEKFGGEFVSSTDKNSDPGRDVTMDLTVRNTGNDAHDFTMNDPQLPEGWANPTWVGGNTKSINPDSSGTFSVKIPIPSDFTKAKAGLYQFIVTGKYEDKGGSETPLPGFLTLNLTVNTIYAVEVSADDTTDSAEPGNTVTFQVKVRNNGNADETYQLNVLKSGSGGDAKPWTTIKGLLPGNQVRIPTGETRYLDVEIVIPDFTEDNDDAEKGLYGVKIKAESTNESTEVDEIIFELNVEEMFRVRLWSDIPGKNETLKENDPTDMSYTLFVRNLGNTDDDILVAVPNDEFTGEKKNWIVKFGAKTSTTLTLDSLSQSSIVLDLTIDKNTDPGEYTLRVRAESQGDTTVAVYSLVYINLTKASYGVRLEKFPSSVRKVNPSDQSEIEFKFTLTNTGNQDDTYTVEVETPLGSGPYKGWIMEFEDKTGGRVSTFKVPVDLKGNTDLYISKNSRVDVTLFVIVAFDEDEGDYSDIAISATSDNDNSQVAYMYFNLTVILPNIRVSDDKNDFWIEPDNDIEEEDSIDINVKIYNDGGAETDLFYVWFYNGKGSSGNEIGGNENSGLIGWEKVDNIPAGQFYEVLTTWEEILGGENDIYVYADKPIKSGDGKTFIDNVFSQDGLVLESKENDNTASIHDDYQKAIDLRPDLTITRVEVDDPERDSTTTVTVTVANVGSAKALSGTGTVSLKIGGTSIRADTATFKGINPFLPEDIDVDDDIDIEFKWDVPDEKKNFTIKVTVDHKEDSDSSNDRYSGYVWSTDPGGGIGGGDSNFLLMAGLGGFSLLLLLVVIVLMMKVKKQKTAGPLPGGPPKKGKGPKGKPGARPPGKPGAAPPPGAKGPPKPGQKPITPPGARGKPGGPPGARPPGGKPGGPPGARPPGARPGGPPGGPGKSMKPCPKCKTPIPITTAKRPLKLICPKCGATGTLNK